MRWTIEISHHMSAASATRICSVRQATDEIHRFAVPHEELRIG